MRDWIYATSLAVAAGLIVAGVGRWSIGAALIVAGLLVAAWATLIVVVGDAGRPTHEPERSALDDDAHPDDLPASGYTAEATP